MEMWWKTLKFRRQVNSSYITLELNMDEGMKSEMLLTHKGVGCVEHEVASIWILYR